MSYRKLNVDGEIWNYVIGKAGVKIKSPKNKSTWVEYSILLGVQAGENYFTDDFDGIKPYDVRKYIDKNLRGKL